MPLLCCVELNDRDHVVDLPLIDAITLVNHIAIVATEIVISIKSSNINQTNTKLINRIRDTCVRPVSLYISDNTDESIALNYLNTGLYRYIVELNVLLQWIKQSKNGKLSIPSNRLICNLGSVIDTDELNDMNLQCELLPYVDTCLYTIPLLGKHHQFVVHTKVLTDEIQQAIDTLDNIHHSHHSTNNNDNQHINHNTVPIISPAQQSVQHATNRHHQLTHYHTASHLYPSSSDHSVLADILIKSLVTDRADKLYSTVVCDESGIALGVVYSSGDSIRTAVQKQTGVYWSRSRNEIWEKVCANNHITI